MTEYDIGKAFEAIENELISSMMRNMKRHKAQETEEGFAWNMWQTEQLKALAEYKKRNYEIYPKKFAEINGQIEGLIKKAYEEGGLEEEAKILKAIKKGFKTGKKILPKSSVDFFKINDRKLNALIESVANDMKKAQTAILRMSDDRYRKAIFNAQVYANAGAGTYEKAVDMATKDMLSAGLNCVEYKNGSRHTLANYAKMAIRTASKRAYLQGEGAKRQEWGISTVILNKRGNPCPLCMPFVGKVFIDDIWSGGKPEDGNYPLLSQAIEKGLYHPNCRDSHTTYFPEISTMDDGWTDEEKEKLQSEYISEQRNNYAKRQAERFERLSEYSLDGDNKRVYKARKEVWKKTVAQNEEKLKADEKDDIITIIKEYKIVDSTLEKELQKRSDKIWKKMLGSEQNALYDYTGAYHGTINKHLRGLISDDKFVRDYTEDLIKNIDRAIQNNVIGEDLILFRGVSKDDFENWKVTEINNTFLSTSIRREVSEDFGDGYLLEIHAPKETEGLYLGDNSTIKHEKEFLLNRNQKYKIIESTNNMLIVELIV